jgi:hypothetical protein
MRREMLAGMLLMLAQALVVATARAILAAPFPTAHHTAGAFLPNAPLRTLCRTRLLCTAAAHDMPSRQQIRKAFERYHQLLPFLYAPAEQSSLCNRRLEHVVPQSILLRQNPLQAANDPHNIYVSMGYVNHARGNFRISFAQCFYDRKHVLSQSRTVAHIGHGNLVDNRQRLFYPRKEDAPLLARTILHMHGRWVFDLQDVTLSPLRDLKIVASIAPASLAEALHSRVADRLIRGLGHTKPPTM